MRAFLDLFWKYRDPDRPPARMVASYSHQYHPEEILAALGLDSISIALGGIEEYVPKGTDYLSPTYCVYSRQMLGFFDEYKNNQVDLPGIDLMIHSNFCNGDYHSLEMVNHYFGLDLVPFMVPYKTTERSFRLVMHRIQKFINALCTKFDKEYFPENLIRVIKESNLLKKKYAELSKSNNVGLEKLEILYELSLAPWNKRYGILSSYLDNHSTTSKAPRFNLVLTGSPVMVGDKFSRIIGNLDIDIKFFDFHFGDQQGITRIPVDKDDLPILGQHVDFSDPIQVLSAYYLEKVAPERMVSGSNHHLARRLDRIFEYEQYLPGEMEINGIISHVLKFCDVYGTDRAMLKTLAQEHHGTPVLDIERDFSSSSTGQLATRIEAFHELLMQKSEVA